MLTPLFEGILAFLAIAALAAGVLINTSAPLESPVSPVSKEYETN
jgi:archaellin